VNADRGVIYVLLEHFVRHLHPRAAEMEKKLDTGARLDDAEIEHVARVLGDIRSLRPLIDRHPEHREIAEGVIGLYADLARRAWRNEAAHSQGKAGA
jgi:hypothetical protein